MTGINFKKHYKRILKIAVPSGLNSLLDITNIVIGIFMVGKISSYHIIAVGLGLNFFMLIYTITNIFFVGTSAQISRLFGKKDFNGITNVLSSMFFGALLASIPIYFLANLSYSAYFNWIGTDITSKILGEIFIHITLYGIPALIAKSILISAFTSIGNTKTPFIIKIITSIVNITLNYILIFGVFFEKLDIVGIALSNLFITYLELVILLALLTRKKSILKLKLFFDFTIFKKGINIGIPVGIERGFTIISLILISKFIAAYGSDYLAGFQIATRIEAFAFMPSFGFMVASMALSGYYLGKNNTKKLKESTYTTIILASIFMGIMGFIMVVFGKHLSLFFSTKDSVLYSSISYLTYVGLSQIPLVFIFVLDGAYRGAGATKISLAINLISIWGLRIFPMYVCYKIGAPIISIYIIILIETFIRGFIFFYVFKRYFHRIFI